jgi:hypothetical protein
LEYSESSEEDPDNSELEEDFDLGTTIDDEDTEKETASKKPTPNSDEETEDQTHVWLQTLHI